MDPEGWKRPIGRGRGGRLRIKSEAEQSPPISPGSTSFPGSSSTLTAALEKLSFDDVRSGQCSCEMCVREARRWALSKPRRDDEFDYISTRPSELETKQGKAGTIVPLLANYFVVKKPTDWAFYEHSVRFIPPPDIPIAKKYMLSEHAEVLGIYISDGTKVYTLKNLTDDTDLKLVSTGRDGIQHDIIIKCVGKLSPGNQMYMQFFNIITRRCLFGMGLEEKGRNFFDHKSAIEVPGQNVVLWPGFVTAMRQHEEEIMLCVEITHKIIRSDTCLQLMEQTRRNCRGDFKEAIKFELEAGIIMTRYNRKTYRVKDIMWDMNPLCTFDFKGKPTTYVDYYKTRYGVTVQDMKQPLLVAKATKRDLDRGEDQLCHLLPELCQMTGLTDEMRADLRLMKDLSIHLHMNPQNRIMAVNKFMKRLLRVEELNAEMQKWNMRYVPEMEKWNMRFDPDMVKCEGRILPKENIVFATSQRNPDPEEPNEKAEWTMVFRDRQMLQSVPLEHWVILVPARDARNVDNLVKTMLQVARPLHFMINRPFDIASLDDTSLASYTNAIDNYTKKYENTLQMVFVILPNNKLELYATVKKRLSVDIGILSQCLLAQNLTNKGLMSVATKLLIQMNTKLGGQPWAIELPLENIMMVGFDVYHSGKGSQKKKSIGAMVSTTSANYASYFSTISFGSNREELSQFLVADLTKCIQAYERVNGVLPERIMFFRDGVGNGNGHLKYVFEEELEQIKTSLTGLYEKAGHTFPKFTFMIVNKKTNTRVFDISRRPDNPRPGTVVDNTITLPERYDFFLVSTATRQGTASPCYYNVLMDTQGIGPDKVQLIAYKMCHMYFNWAGTVAVPAPCQYAHKLAFLSGIVLDAQPSGHLSNLLHFL